MATSDFQTFFEVATGPCKNAVNLACGDFLSSLCSLLSFLCSLPSSLLGGDPFLSSQRTTNPVVNQLLLFKKPHLEISGGLFGDHFSLLSSRFSLRSSLFSLLSSRLSSLIPLCSLPSSLFSLCSLPSSLAAAHFSDRSSHLSLRTLHQAIHFASNPLDPVPHHPWPGGMREAMK